MTLMLKLDLSAPYWHAEVGREMATRFAKDYPERVGVRDGVLFHVQRGDECVSVYVWRTPKGTVKADAAVAKPLNPAGQ